MNPMTDDSYEGPDDVEDCARACVVTFGCMAIQVDGSKCLMAKIVRNEPGTWCGGNTAIDTIWAPLPLFMVQYGYDRTFDRDLQLQMGDTQGCYTYQPVPGSQMGPSFPAEASTPLKSAACGARCAQQQDCTCVSLYDNNCYNVKAPTPCGCLNQAQQAKPLPIVINPSIREVFNSFGPIKYNQTCGIHSQVGHVSICFPSDDVASSMVLECVQEWADYNSFGNSYDFFFDCKPEGGGLYGMFYCTQYITCEFTESTYSTVYSYFNDLGAAPTSPPTQHSEYPTVIPTANPTNDPSRLPSANPTNIPSAQPSISPSRYQLVGTDRVCTRARHSATKSDYFLVDTDNDYVADCAEHCFQAQYQSSTTEGGKCTYFLYTDTNECYLYTTTLCELAEHDAQTQANVSTYRIGTSLPRAKYDLMAKTKQCDPSFNIDNASTLQRCANYCLAAAECVTFGFSSTLLGTQSCIIQANCSSYPASTYNGNSAYDLYRIVETPHYRYGRGSCTGAQADLIATTSDDDYPAIGTCANACADACDCTYFIVTYDLHFRATGCTYVPGTTCTIEPSDNNIFAVGTRIHNASTPTLQHAEATCGYHDKYWGNTDTRDLGAPTVYTNTVQDCANICHANANCSTFTYGRDGSQASYRCNTNGCACVPEYSNSDFSVHGCEHDDVKYSDGYDLYKLSGTAGLELNVLETATDYMGHSTFSFGTTCVLETAVEAVDDVLAIDPTGTLDCCSVACAATFGCTTFLYTAATYFALGSVNSNASCRMYRPPRPTKGTSCNSYDLSGLNNAVIETYDYRSMNADHLTLPSPTHESITTVTGAAANSARCANCTLRGGVCTQYCTVEVVNDRTDRYADICTEQTAHQNAHVTDIIDGAQGSIFTYFPCSHWAGKSSADFEVPSVATTPMTLYAVAPVKYYRCEAVHEGRTLSATTQQECHEACWKNTTCTWFTFDGATCHIATCLNATNTTWNFEDDTTTIYNSGVSYDRFDATNCAETALVTLPVPTALFDDLRTLDYEPLDELFWCANHPHTVHYRFFMISSLKNGTRACSAYAECTPSAIEEAQSTEAVPYVADGDRMCAPNGKSEPSLTNRLIAYGKLDANETEKIRTCNTYCFHSTVNSYVGFGLDASGAHPGRCYCVTERYSECNDYGETAYDTYAFVKKPHAVFEHTPNNFYQIGTGAVCTGQYEDIGDVPTLDECRTKCYNQKGCVYFSYANTGASHKCWWEAINSVCNITTAHTTNRARRVDSANIDFFGPYRSARNQHAASVEPPVVDLNLYVLTAVDPSYTIAQSALLDYVDTAIFTDSRDLPYIASIELCAYAVHYSNDEHDWDADPNITKNCNRIGTKDCKIVHPYFAWNKETHSCIVHNGKHGPATTTEVTGYTLYKLRSVAEYDIVGAFQEGLVCKTVTSESNPNDNSIRINNTRSATECIDHIIQTQPLHNQRWVSFAPPTNSNEDALCTIDVVCDRQKVVPNGTVYEIDEYVTPKPTKSPTLQPTGFPSASPTANPTNIPTNQPSHNPSANPTSIPTAIPSLTGYNGTHGEYVYTDPPVAPNGSECITTLSMQTSSTVQMCADRCKIADQDTTIGSCRWFTYRPDSNTELASCSVATPDCTMGSLPNAVTYVLTNAFTDSPSSSPTTSFPSLSPSGVPTANPSANPSALPTAIPSNLPTSNPTNIPSTHPTELPADGFHPADIPPGAKGVDCHGQETWHLTETYFTTNYDNVLACSRKCAITFTCEYFKVDDNHCGIQIQPCILPLVVTLTKVYVLYQMDGIKTYTPTQPPTTSPPSASPTQSPTASPTAFPTGLPTKFPTGTPSISPTFTPTGSPTLFQNATDGNTDDKTGLIIGLAVSGGLFLAIVTWLLISKQEKPYASVPNTPTVEAKTKTQLNSAFM